MPEQVLASFRPTRFLFLKHYFLTILLIITGIVLFFDLISRIRGLAPNNYYYLLLIPLGLIPSIIAEIRIRNDAYIMTNQKIIEKKGILNIEEKSIMWNKLTNYSLRQTLLDRLVGIGTIDLWSVGEEIKPEISIKKVSHIKRIKELLDKLIEVKKEGPVV